MDFVLVRSCGDPIGEKRGLRRCDEPLGQRDPRCGVRRLGRPRTDDRSAIERDLVLASIGGPQRELAGDLASLELREGETPGPIADLAADHLRHVGTV